MSSHANGAVVLVVVLALGASGRARADRQVSANSAMGFGTSVDKNKEASADREQANKIVNKEENALSDTAATPAQPADQVQVGKGSSRSDEGFKAQVKTELVDLSTRITKLRNRVLADAEFKSYDARAGLARLDERWQKLEEIVSQWSATKGSALKPAQKNDVAQRLNNLKVELAKQEVEASAATEPKK